MQVYQRGDLKKKRLMSVWCNQKWCYSFSWLLLILLWAICGGALIIVNQNSIIWSPCDMIHVTLLTLAYIWQNGPLFLIPCLFSIMNSNWFAKSEWVNILPSHEIYEHVEFYIKKNWIPFMEVHKSTVKLITPCDGSASQLSQFSYTTATFHSQNPMEKTS